MEAPLERGMARWQKLTLAVLGATAVAINVVLMVLVRSINGGLVFGLVLTLPLAYAMLVVRTWHKR